MKRIVHRTVAAGFLAAVTLAAGLGTAGAVTYTGGDLLYVAYQPHGRELIVDLGPASTLLGASTPVAITRLAAGDLTGLFGSPLPPLKVALYATSGPDGFIASNGPTDPALVGSAAGASSQIGVLGSNAAYVSRPVAGNPDAAYFEFGDIGSYQVTLDAVNPGSIGNNVPFNAESDFAGGRLAIPVFEGRFNPFTGVPPTQSLVGHLGVAPDGTLTYQPLRLIQAACTAGPATLNPKSEGGGFSFDVVLTDVTDPDHPTPVPLSRMAPAFILQAGSTVLPPPDAGPGCAPAEDGIWETPAARTDTSIGFIAGSDGDCSTMDGNRQDILAVIGPESGDQPICFASMVDGNPVSCCDTVRVLEKSRR